MEQTIKLELTINEINTILSGLGNLPYIQVDSLIPKIKEQAYNQIQDSKKPKDFKE